MVVARRDEAPPGWFSKNSKFSFDAETPPGRVEPWGYSKGAIARVPVPWGGSYRAWSASQWMFAALGVMAASRKTRRRCW